VFKSRGKQHNLTKLQASTCYRFRLAAVNEYGKRYVTSVIDTTEMNKVAACNFTNSANGHSCNISDLYTGVLIEFMSVVCIIGEVPV
jgi:hypothetical protein